MAVRGNVHRSRDCPDSVADLAEAMVVLAIGGLPFNGFVLSTRPLNWLHGVESNGARHGWRLQCLYKGKRS